MSKIEKLIDDFFDTLGDLKNEEQMQKKSQEFLAAFMGFISESMKNQDFETLTKEMETAKTKIQVKVKELCEKNNIPFSDFEQLMQNPEALFANIGKLDELKKIQDEVQKHVSEKAEGNSKEKKETQPKKVKKGWVEA